MDIERLKSTAEYYCDLYRLGKINREKAKEYIVLYLDYVNAKSKELTKKYNQKHKDIWNGLDMKIKKILDIFYVIWYNKFIK